MSPLMTTGILDSIATLKLISHLEREYSVAFEAHETDYEHMNTIQDIAGMVRSKK